MRIFKSIEQGHIYPQPRAHTIHGWPGIAFEGETQVRSGDDSRTWVHFHHDNFLSISDATRILKGRGLLSEGQRIHALEDVTNSRGHAGTGDPIGFVAAITALPRLPRQDRPSLVRQPVTSFHPDEREVRGWWRLFGS